MLRKEVNARARLFSSSEKKMLRVADRDAKWAKWRAMASGVLDKSKLGRVLTARNVGAAGALVAAVGAGFLGSRYLAESQKKEGALRLDLDTRLSELSRTLEAQHEKLHEQQTGLETKLDSLLGHKRALGKALARTEARNTISRREVETGQVEIAATLKSLAARQVESLSRDGASDRGKHASINPVEQRQSSSAQIANEMFDNSFAKVEATVAAPRATRSPLRHSSALPVVDPLEGLTVDLAARLLSAADNLDAAAGRADRCSGELLSAKDLLVGAKETLEERHLVHQTQLERALTTIHTLLEDLHHTGAGAQPRFGSAPLVLTLARALSAVSLPDRPEIARQMARVILATAALEAHREAPESGRVAEARATDLYTTDRAD